MPDFSKLCSYLCICLIPFAAAVYEVCGIILLVDNYNNRDNPCVRNIWPYVLVSLIAAVSHLGAVKDRESVEKNICSILFLTLLNASLASWGGVELANPICNSMHGDHFFTFGLATFILQAVSGALALITVCCVAIACSLQNRYDETSHERLLYNQV